MYCACEGPNESIMDLSLYTNCAFMGLLKGTTMDLVVWQYMDCSYVWIAANLSKVASAVTMDAGSVSSKVAATTLGLFMGW